MSREVSLSRWKWLILDLLLPLVVTAGLTWYFASKNRDVVIERWFFDGESKSWPTGELPFWQAVYDFGTLPAALVAIVAVVVFVLGFRWAKWARYRRASAFLFLVAAVAAGIVANLILKENWGRPRPREVAEFGGRNEFEQVLTIDPTSDGKSFPCGHATMGFFFVAFYFLLRKARPAWSIVALAAGLGFGTLLGITRMLQGGHFASDVVWAAAVTFFSAAGLFYLLRLNRGVLDNPQDLAAKRKIPLKIKVFGVVAVGAGLAAVMLATPYSAKRNYELLTTLSEKTRLDISLEVVCGEVKIVAGDVFSIRGEAWGHGVPTSKIADQLQEKMQDNGKLRVRYKQRWSGFLTESGQRLTVTIPWERVRVVKLDFSDVVAEVELPRREGQHCHLDWETVRSEIVARLHDGVSVSTDAINSGKISDETAGMVKYLDPVPRSIETEYRLLWKEGEGGEVTVKR